MARVKNIEAFCSVCNAVQKMELAGEVSTSEEEIDIDDIEDEKIRKNLMKKKEVEIKEYA